ncbi:MAG: S8 family serine peptidase [Candidatus Eisenbacteria bacterium]
MALLALACVPPLAHAGPYVWDQDEDGLDDRMETVNLLGYRFAFTNADTLGRQRFEVSQQAGGLVYGVYVVFDHPPTATDLTALAAIGMPVLHRLDSVPAVRSTATFTQAALARSLAGVERIEVIPIAYAALHDALAAIGEHDPSQVVFPSWDTAGLGGPGAGGPAVGGVPTRRGAGIVVAILDTGINDAPDGNYPGHESLLAHVVGGADYTHGDSLLDTPQSGSVNPTDHGGPGTNAHGTYIAGIVAGTGGSSGYAPGVAPNARLVDVRVLGDLGKGSAVAEAIDWCIANRARDWGDPDPSVRGIDVINLSLSSMDLSDGNDVASRAAARAVASGILVVASMGNDGLSAHVPSPAAGDGVIAVGAWDIQRTGAPGDDRPATFSNTGPRAGDGDLDAADEQKPTLLAPGVGTLAPDGDPTSDGAQYRRASGTSGAAAMVSGVLALLASAHPGASPQAITGWLTSTARRNLPGLAPGTLGVDPGWDSARGFGVVDAYAADLEAIATGRTQVRRLQVGATADSIRLELWSQRERGALHLALERALDSNGAPGAYAVYDSFACAGDPSLADGTNCTVYARSWPIAPADRGLTFWYRAAYSEDGMRFVGPARRLDTPSGTSRATLEATIVHNAYDHDIDAVFEGVSGYAGSPGLVSWPLPGSSAAVASEWVSGISTTGNVSQTFRVEIPAGAADSYLPPSDSSPWTLRVSEGGYLNRAGRIERFRLTWHGPNGDVVYEGSPTPAPTIEGQTTRVRIPAAVTGVPDFGASERAGLAAFPNPARANGAVQFSVRASAATRVDVFDLAGRRVGVAPLMVGASGLAEGRWIARDVRGAALAPGVYFARAGRALTRRLVLLAP